MPAYERFMVVADNHGDMADADTIKAEREFAGWWKPKHRIHLGDNWDFRWLRSKASADDQYDQNLQADFDAGVEFLDWYRPTIFLMGNHDHRVVKGMDSPNPSKSKLCSLLLGDIQDALHGVKAAPYNKRLGAVRFGDLTLVHGYAAGIGALRAHVLTYGRCLMGHIHASDQLAVERLDGAVGYSVGCGCRLEMGYNESQRGTLRQQNGFAYGLIFPSGKTQVWLAAPMGDTWYIPSEMREVKRAKSNY